MERPLPSVFGSAACLSGEGGDGLELELPAESRYADPVEIGRGAMGRVWAVHDRRLGRTVAMKVANPGAEGRFEREARVAARLDHPGIVTVYDAGVGEDGRPWMAMELVRGKPLDAVLAETPDVEGRLRWLRHLLAACEAVAHAHDRGVIHRDLKPANIVVGSLGEARVVDWGLARPLDEADDPGDAQVPEGSGTRLGAVVGTPSTMSPEQARGERVDRTADVWALGVTLAELLDGPTTADAETLLVERRAGRFPPPVQGPPALQAIVRRCTEPSPADRYPDASALADDLRAWLDGARVSAHSYGSAEALALVLRRWRRPLIGLAVALTALAVLAVAAFLAIGRERDRAVEAERDARAQRDAARESLRTALVREAVEQLGREAGFEAVASAQAALTLGTDPEALGVLAAFPGPPPTHLRTVPCERGRWSPDLAHTACVVPGGVRVDERPIADPGADDVVWSAGRVVRLHGYDAVVPGPDGDRTLASEEAGRPVPGTGLLQRGRRGLTLYTAPDDAVEVCADSAVGVAAVGPDRIWAVCADGEVLGAAPGEPFVAIATVDARVGWLAVAASADAVVLGGSDGQVVVLEPDGRQRYTVRLPLRSVDHLAVGSWIAASGPSEAPLLLDPATGDIVASLPHGEQVQAAVGSRVGTQADGALHLWTLDPDSPRLRLRSPGGITALGVAGEGLLAADGSGHLLRWDDRGRRTASARVAPDVLRDLAVSPDQTRVAVTSMASEPVLILDSSNLMNPETRDRKVLPRRLLWTGEDPVALSYGRRVRTLVDGAPLLEAAVDDLALTPDGMLGLDGETLVRIDDGIATPLRAIPGARGLTWAGDALVVQGDRHLSWEGVRVEVPSLITAVLADPDRVMAGSLDGSARVWDRQGRLIAVLRGHTARVSALAARQDRIWTGSWDGTVRAWTLTPP